MIMRINRTASTPSARAMLQLKVLLTLKTI